jgi:hypothetical protein
LTANRVVQHDTSLFVNSEIESVVVGLCVDGTNKRDPTITNEVNVNLQDSSDTVLALNARFDTVAQSAPAALIAVRDVVDVFAIDVSVGAFVSNEDFRVSRPSRPTSQALLDGGSSSQLTISTLRSTKGQVSARTARDGARKIVLVVGQSNATSAVGVFPVEVQVTLVISAGRVIAVNVIHRARRHCGIEALFVISIVNDIRASVRGTEQVQAKSFAALILGADGITSRDQGASSAVTQKSFAEAFAQAPFVASLSNVRSPNILVSSALHASSLSYGVCALRFSVDVYELRNLSSDLVVTGINIIGKTGTAAAGLSVTRAGSQSGRRRSRVNTRKGFHAR